MRLAVIVQLPAPTMVTVVPLTEQTPDERVLKLTTLSSVFVVVALTSKLSSLKVLLPSAPKVIEAESLLIVMVTSSVASL